MTRLAAVVVVICALLLTGEQSFVFVQKQSDRHARIEKAKAEAKAEDERCKGDFAGCPLDLGGI